MKYKREMLDDNLVKIKMFTADYRVPELLAFVKENNPNDKNKDMPPDLMAT